MVRRRLWWALVLVPWVVGCASTRVVRLDTGEGAPLEYAPASSDASVEVDSDDFEEALAQLVLAVPLTLRPSQAGLLVRASTWAPAADAAWQQVMRRDYGRWCQARDSGGDCLSLLEDGLGLGELDRLTLALGFAVDPMRESVREAVRETLNPRVFQAVVVTGLATWVALLAAPEPLVTKAAAVMSAVMVVYLGVGPFLALVRASFELKQATDRARTFAELEVAGERFGRVLGREGTQVAILTLAALLGQGMTGPSGLAARLRMMPAFAEAAALGEAQVGLVLEAVGQVTSVAVVDGTLVVALPATAVAMAANGGGPKPHKHHIATIRNEVSTARGGPWTPRFRDLFRKAGMELDEVENIVPILGHKGPHPEEYHRYIFEEVSRALGRCRGVPQCKVMLKEQLRQLAKQISTPGTRLHELVTKGVPH